MKLVTAFAVAAALATSALAAPEPAAQPPIPVESNQARADKLFIDGQASYQRGEFQAAIEQFKQAYDLVRDPVYLFNIAQSYRRIGDCVGAFENYKRYLEEAPAADNKDKVTQWLSELQPCVDEREQEKQEAARRAAEQAKRDRERERMLDALARTPVDTEIDRGQPFRIAGYVLTGLGVAGVVTGIVYSIKGGNARDDIATRCSPPNTCLWDSPEIQQLHDAGERANANAKIGYVGGGIAVVAGVALYVFGRARVEHVTVTPAPGGATVGAQLSF